MADKYYFSKYSIAVRSNSNNLILCNSLYGSLARINSKSSSYILKLVDREVSSIDIDNPIVSTLIEQGFLVSNKVDEFQHVESLLSKEDASKSCNFTIVLNRTCNFNCSYCYEKITDEVMSSGVADAICKYIKTFSANGKLINISLFGGEPLISQNRIFQILRNLSQSKSLENAELKCGITTNGYLLNKKIAEKLVSYGCRFFQITLDGPPDVHNAKRPHCNRNGTYTAIVNNIRGLLDIKKKLKVTIRVNFDQFSYIYVLKWIDDIKAELNNDQRIEFSFHPIWNSEETICPKLNSSNRISLVEQTVSLLLASGKDAYTYIKKAKLNGDFCSAVNENKFVIIPNGSLLKCEAILDESSNKIGVLDKTGTPKYKIENLELWRKLPALNNDCNSCWYYPACRGVSCHIFNLKNMANEKICPLGKDAIPILIKNCF